MGIAERKERQRQELRGQILDAARAITVRDGFGGLTMRKIAEAIEYSPGTIYLYFQSREEIGRQLVREAFEELLRYFAPAQDVASAVERLRVIGMRYVAFALEQPNAYRLLFMTDAAFTEELFGRPDEQIDDSAGDRAFGVLAETVAEAIRLGQLRPVDPALTAEMLWASLHGILSLHIGCELALDSDPRGLAVAMIDTLLRGLVA